MKNLNLGYGGHPLKNDDFNLLQSAYSESFKAIISVFDPSLNIILSGFIITETSTTITCTEGYVSWLGEIYKIDSVSFAKQNGGQLYLQLDEVVMPPSPVTYKDQTLQNVHLNRKLKFKYYAAGDTGEYLAAFTRASSLGFKRGMILDFIGNTSTNFDQRGLGINDLSGFAVCNGNTFTISGGIQYTVPDLRGRGRIGASNVPSQDAPTYDAATLSNPSITQTGGSAFFHITQGNLPNYNLPVNTTGFRVGINVWQKWTRFQDSNNSRIYSYGPNASGGDAFQTTLYSDVISGSITVNSGGNGDIIDRRGAWWAGIPIIKL